MGDAVYDVLIDLQRMANMARKEVLGEIYDLKKRAEHAETELKEGLKRKREEELLAAEDERNFCKWLHNLGYELTFDRRARRKIRMSNNRGGWFSSIVRELVKTAELSAKALSRVGDFKTLHNMSKGIRDEDYALFLEQIV
jgi:hypothetical protein